MGSKPPSESGPPPGEAPRRRLSRTFSSARWPEYGRLLKAALGHGYEVCTVEQFLSGDGTTGRVMILRHDVDQHPPAAIVMSDIEVALGVRSTWYLRWRTARPEVIRELRRRGGEIGLHYETLTRMALAGAEPMIGPEEWLEHGREILREEISAFEDAFGEIRSVAAHGDTRVPQVRNGDLLRDQVPAEYGIDFDANEAMRRHRLAAWVTDRPGGDGAWSDGVDPFELLRTGESPILCLTHPNNWISGVSLWRDRFSSTLRGVSDAPPPSR